MVGTAVAIVAGVLWHPKVGDGSLGDGFVGSLDEVFRFVSEEKSHEVFMGIIMFQ